MSRPEDESSTELAWREIVENYGERAVLPDDLAGAAPGGSAATSEPLPPDEVDERTVGTPGATPPETAGPLPDHLADDDPVEAREQAVEEAARFRPPPPPPFPVPRTWQRGLAWSGIFVAPVLALVIALFSIYVNPLIGWLLVSWFVGGFLYLVLEMPSAPRDPWDDGSRI
ncbi:hypothetical protein [Nocardioides hwasunensis]|uniref:DUF1707 domain-containing protein n=1 Tax=Nocardioides hwasunensis TaxID=397258 RepID=A0ABR8MDX8_9ACTN|nr:hypothetical protein [Nocardioides hwasunensis]MBD3913411.1 hypothetical protein [Nocardioides hwasunensis]